MTDVDKRSAEYLLGGMPDHEREAFERDFFADPSAFERLAQAESDLLDAYVRHRLAPDQRARVERVYVADPRRRERVRFAQALADAADAAAFAAEDRPRGRPVWWGWPIAAAAAIAALLIVATTLAVQVQRLRRELADTTAARASTERASDALRGSEPARGSHPAAEGTVVAFSLFAGSTRTANTGSIPTFAVPRTAQDVRLELVADRTEYAWYRLTLQRAGGPEIAALDRVQPRADGSRVTFAMTVPATSLAAGDYVFTVRGILATGEVDEVSRSLLRVDTR